jgi:hypothetical protein
MSDRATKDSRNSVPTVMPSITMVLAARMIPFWQRGCVSSSFAGVGEIVPELTVAIVDFEGRPLNFNNLIAVHVFELRCFPAHQKLSCPVQGLSLKIVPRPKARRS